MRLATARVALLLLGAELSPSAATVPPARDALLRVRVAGLQPDNMRSWIQRRSFAAVLPIQPMLIERTALGMDLTFRRKPNSEKGGVDGGLRFTVAAPESDGIGALLVSRISEGQYTAKAFSEQRICSKLLSDLEQLPQECGSVTSVIDFRSTASS